MKVEDPILCPYGHDDVQHRPELKKFHKIPENQTVYLCLKCLDVFYRDDPGIILL